MNDQAASLTDYSSGHDELGHYARLSVDPSVYSMTAILKTAYWFTEQCYLYLAKRNDRIEVEFRLKTDASDAPGLKTLCEEFLNNLLDQCVRQKVLEETSGIRDALLQKAFFEAKSKANSVPKELISVETHIPDVSHSFRNDPLNISGR